MNAADAKNLTIVPEMVLWHVNPRYEFWEGGIMYSFIPSPQMDEMIDEIMIDTSTLCVWLDPNGNGIVSSKIQKR